MPISKSKDLLASPGISPPSYPSLSSPPTSTYQYPLEVPPIALEILPSAHLVGSKSTPPLISCSNVLAHLRLLGAFHTLEQSITTPSLQSDDPSEPPGAVLWRVFLHQAVWRFEIWVKRVVKSRGVNRGGLRDEEIPPLDVLLVWHAYLLNPRVYAEDTMRVHPELAALGGLPLERIAAQVDPDNLKFKPTPVQAAFWEQETLAPREPLSLSLSSRHELAVECPRCGGPPVQVSWLSEPHLTSTGEALGKGWCQNQFSVKCTSCQFKITRESIAVGRFAADIAEAMVKKNSFLPGMLFSPITCERSTTEAEITTNLLLQPFVDLPPSQQAIGEHLGWSFAGIEENVTKARDITATVIRAKFNRAKFGNNAERKAAEGVGLPTRAGTDELAAKIIGARAAVPNISIQNIWRSFGPRIAKMLASYRDNPAPFSLDLVGAILRQTTFTSKIFALRWLNPSNHNPPLVQSITRYHKFLHVLAKYPGHFLVPTLDIDLGWHTHQLSGKAYMSDTKRCVGRYVDHDDKVEEGVLSDGFDDTSHLWQSTFRAPYSSCESLQQTPIVKGNKLAQRLSSASDSSNKADPTTYPSEHSSILVVQDSRILLSRFKREQKRAKGKFQSTGEEPFVRNARIPAVGVGPNTLGGAVAFGSMGLAGWALLGEIDQSVLNAQTVEKGQCCAGFGMPYYANPVVFDGAYGGCAAAGCSAGACEADDGCGGGGGTCGGGDGCGGGGGGGCGGGGCGGCGG